MAIIATVTYQYGAGNGPDNRQIDFVRIGGALGPLEARVSVVGQPGNTLGIIPANKIRVEMESTIQKANRMVMQRNGLPVPLPKKDRLLSSLSNIAQDNVIRSINVNSTVRGGRWIDVDMSPGPYNESVTALLIMALP